MFVLQQKIFFNDCAIGQVGIAATLSYAPYIKQPADQSWGGKKPPEIHRKPLTDQEVNNAGGKQATGTHCQKGAHKEIAAAPLRFRMISTPCERPRCSNTFTPAKDFSRQCWQKELPRETHPVQAANPRGLRHRSVRRQRRSGPKLTPPLQGCFWKAELWWESPCSHKEQMLVILNPTVNSLKQLSAVPQRQPN